MTLLPETLCTDIYTTEKVMEPPDEILIAILALSSPTDLPRIVRARGSSRGKRGVRSTRRDRDSFQRYCILIARIVRSSREDISCFLFDDEGYRAKVRMLFHTCLVCPSLYLFLTFRKILFINDRLWLYLQKANILYSLITIS